jgi:hypothetical protein
MVSRSLRGDLGRFTHDVDLSAALDLEEFVALTDQLIEAGWKRAYKPEHRWLTSRDTCAISFAYTPSTTGWRNATLALHDNSANGSYTIPLLGLGY